MTAATLSSFCKRTALLFHRCESLNLFAFFFPGAKDSSPPLQMTPNRLSSTMTRRKYVPEVCLPPPFHPISNSHFDSFFSLPLVEREELPAFRFPPPICGGSGTCVIRYPPLTISLVGMQVRTVVFVIVERPLFACFG